MMNHTLNKIGDAECCSTCGAVNQELTASCVGRLINREERHHIREQHLDFDGEVWLATVQDKVYRVRDSEQFNALQMSAVSLAAVHHAAKAMEADMDAMAKAFADLAVAVRDYEVETELMLRKEPKPFWQRIRGRWSR